MSTQVHVNSIEAEVENLQTFLPTQVFLQSVYSSHYDILIS